MAKHDVVRAWKDPSYRASLQADELARLPLHPAGLVSLTDQELKEASGIESNLATTAWFCTLSEFMTRCCP